MTWQWVSCKEECGEQIQIGSYMGDYEDEYTDYEIVVTCGECNRAKQGLPSRYEEEQAERESAAELFANFKNRLENEGIENIIDFSVIDDDVGALIEMLVTMWNEKKHPRYLDALWGMLKTQPRNGLKVVAE